MWAEVTVVIPNFNGAEFILESLQAVQDAADRYPGEVHIVVVDDGSTDNSVLAIGERHPAATVVAKTTNAGFAQAVKTGIQTAATEWVVLLNSDVYPDVGFLQPLLRWIETEDLFAVGCRIERSDGTVEKVSWVRRKLKWGSLTTQPWHMEDYNQLLARDQAAFTLFASGGSMLVNRQKFLELDGFLPLFEPFYYEDVDLGIRAWRCGWKVLAEPASRVVHDSGQTIDKVNRASRVDRVRKRNKLYVDWLHLDGPGLWLLSLPRTGLKALGWLLKGRWLELQALGDALQNRTALNFERKAVQDSSRYTLSQVLAVFDRINSVDPPQKAQNITTL